MGGKHVSNSKERFVMRRTVLFALAIVCTFVVSSVHDAISSPGNEPIRLMRRPDINNGRIVFAWAGDLWMVPEEGGQARRLTVHVGTEDYPKFSPDGTLIAFSGDFDERSNAICTIRADGTGGTSLLTYNATGGTPVCWTRDGANIIFSSTQESFVRFFTTLFRVPAGGGLPVELEIGKASFACYSPDGTKIAYNLHPNLFWWWKRYKGSMNQDIWTYDFKTGQFTQITNWEGTDAWPMWTGNRIYFVSDREGAVNNIFSYDLGSGQTTQVTRFEKHGVTWPSMSADGTRIVFEREGRLYVLDTAKGEPREVVVYAPIDTPENMISYIDPAKYLNSFDVSPSAKRIAFEARGDIFTMPAEHGDVRNLTESSGARDVSPSWSPDGKWVAYVSDKNGDDEVYLVDQMGKEKEKKLTSNGHFKNYIMWSPLSDKMVYTTEENKLYLLDKDGGTPKVVAQCDYGEISSYSWSPDGAWLAYALPDRNHNRDIFIYDVKKGETHQITTDLGDDTEPYFVPDGKYLLLLTNRVGGNARSLARLSLLPEEKPPFEFKDDEETGVSEEDTTGGSDADKEDAGMGRHGDREKGKKGKAAEAEKEKKKVEVKIDFTNIESRIRRIPKTGGSGVHNIQATERYYYYLIQGARRFLFRPSYDLYMYDTEKLKAEKVATGIATYGIAANHEKLVTWDGSEFDIIRVGSKAPPAKKDSDGEDQAEKYDFARYTHMKLDRTAEWKQIFDEAWRVEKYLFYDPKLHGVDWNEVHDYYGSLVPYVQTRGELNILLTEMVGELNASHQGVSGGDSPEVPRAPQGFLGAKIVLDEKTGYPRIVKIYYGDKASLTDKSPLDNDYVKVKPGDYLLAIDGHEIQPGEDFNKYLVDKTGNKITIMTNSKPELKGAIETTLLPNFSDAKLVYEDWARANEKWVDDKSGGRIGYMHLSDMSASGLVEFQEKFNKYRYKDAVIIDVRYNGGGNIDERIIDLLERRPYQVTQARNEAPEPRPRDGFYGDLVVLINEYSFSDAEVFPAAFKTRGLGTVIGTPTLGYVLAVTPHVLIDGGQVRKAFIGIWDITTGQQLESHGVQPDILVPSPPDMEKAGRDVQLEKAVEFLMAKNPKSLNKVDGLPIPTR
jgi:tricorn protease